MGLLIVLGIIVWIGYAIVNSTAKPSSSPTQSVQPAEFTLRLQEVNLGDPPKNFAALAIQAVGPFPIKYQSEVTAVVSLFDETDTKNWMPVFSSVSSFQEPETNAFQHTTQLGTLRVGYGFVKWVRIGVVIPEVLDAPYSGERNFIIAVRLFEKGTPPPIEFGYCKADAQGLFFTHYLRFTRKVAELGYVEQKERADQAAVLTVKLAMAVAMSDGTLCDAEGGIIKAWAKKRVDSIRAEKRSAELKGKINQAMRTCYERSESTIAAIPLVAKELRELNLKAQCYEAIELCFDVLAADGVAAQAEMAIVNEIARLLAIDTEEFNRMRDQRIVKVDTSALVNDDPEKFLGIEPDWPLEQKQRHLRKEFQKWNSRLNQLPEGQERDSAQRMLDRIAQTRTSLK